MQVCGGSLAALAHHVVAELLALDEPVHSHALDRTDVDDAELRQPAGATSREPRPISAMSWKRPLKADDQAGQISNADYIGCSESFCKRRRRAALAKRGCVQLRVSTSMSLLG